MSFPLIPPWSPFAHSLFPPLSPKDTSRDLYLLSNLSVPPSYSSLAPGSPLPSSARFPLSSYPSRCVPRLLSFQLRLPLRWNHTLYPPIHLCLRDRSYTPWHREIPSKLSLQPQKGSKERDRPVFYTPLQTTANEERRRMGEGKELGGMVRFFLGGTHHGRCPDPRWYPVSGSCPCSCDSPPPLSSLSRASL